MATFIDQSTADQLNAECAALIKERGVNGKEAIVEIIRRYAMSLIIDDQGIDLWRLPDGRLVTVWWESPFGQAISVETAAQWESAAVGFDFQNVWEDRIGDV